MNRPHVDMPQQAQWKEGDRVRLIGAHKTLSNTGTIERVYISWVNVLFDTGTTASINSNCLVKEVKE